MNWIWISLFIVVHSIGGMRAEDNQGLYGVYNARRFPRYWDEPLLRRVDGQIDFDWGYGGPGFSVPEDQFTARWTGWIVPSYSEEFTFAVFASGAAKLIIEGRTIVNIREEWGDEGSGRMKVRAGQKYKIQLDYVDRQKGAMVRLYWSSPSLAREIVPAQALIPELHTPTPPAIVVIAIMGSLIFIVFPRTLYAVSCKSIHFLAELRRKIPESLS